jgi:hypothetical protein
VVVVDVEVQVDVEGVEDGVEVEEVVVDEAPVRLHDFANVKRPVVAALLQMVVINHHGNPTLRKSIWIPPFGAN